MDRKKRGRRGEERRESEGVDERAEMMEEEVGRGRSREREGKRR